MINNHHFCKYTKTSKTLNSLYPPELKFSKIRRKFREFFLISEKFGRKCYTPLGMSGYIYEKERQLNQFGISIHPYSEFCHWWELLVMTEIFFSLLIRPFIIAQLTWEGFFRTDYQLLGLCADLIDMMDTGLRFLVGYLEKDGQNVVLESRKIFYHNVTQLTFYARVLSSFPFEFLTYLYAISRNCRHSAFLFIIFIKIFRLLPFNRYLKHTAKIYNWSEISATLAWVVLNMPLYYQWLICFFHLTIFSEEFRTQNKNQFVYEKGIFFRHVILAYIVFNPFFYEIGFHSKLDLQEYKDKLITCLILFTSNILSIIVMGLLVYLFGLLKTSGIEYAELIQEVRKFLSQENLPKHVHLKVNKYFQFRYQNNYFREKRILDTVSPPVKREIRNFLCMNLLINPESIFYDVSMELANSLCQQMTFEVFLPGDEIIRAGKRARKMYFIYSGSVAVFSPSGDELLHLYEGQQFGESTFIIHNSYAVTVVALEMTECYFLLQSDFIKSTVGFPDFKNVIVNSAIKRRKFFKGLYSGA